MKHTYGKVATYVNKQKFRIWSDDNRQVIVEILKQSPFDAPYGPIESLIHMYFFLNNNSQNVTINRKRYRDINQLDAINVANMQPQQNN